MCAVVRACFSIGAIAWKLACCACADLKLNTYR
jgi:hypothetical protein